MEAQQIDANTTKTRPGTLTRRTYLRHVRHRTLADLDKRSRGGRRALQLVKFFEAQLNGEITEAQRMAIARAAAMQAIAEDALIRRVNGDTTISHEDVVRLDHSAERALRMLGIGVKVEPPSPELPSLGSLLRSERS